MQHTRQAENTNIDIIINLKGLLQKVYFAAVLLNNGYERGIVPLFLFLIIFYLQF